MRIEHVCLQIVMCLLLVALFLSVKGEYEHRKKVIAKIRHLTMELQMSNDYAEKIEIIKELNQLYQEL